MAVADESLCGPMLGKDVVHIMDKNNKMTASAFGTALQTIFPGDTVEKMHETFAHCGHYQTMLELIIVIRFTRQASCTDTCNLILRRPRTHIAPGHMLSTVKYMGRSDAQTAVLSP